VLSLVHSSKEHLLQHTLHSSTFLSLSPFNFTIFAKMFSVLAAFTILAALAQAAPLPMPATKVSTPTSIVTREIALIPLGGSLATSSSPDSIATTLLADMVIRAGLTAKPVS
jgi:hypothetical protein